MTDVLIKRELLEQVASEFEHDNDRYMLGRELRAILAAPAAPGADAGLVEALEKIAAYAPCSGIKDPGFTKMHMGILARDALAVHRAVRFAGGAE